MFCNKIVDRINKNKIMLLTRDKIDYRQHGFVGSKSCTSNLVDFCDSLAINMNSRLRTDVIYFDFAKAFDSVNHDIILRKLKNDYGIDGMLLKFICNYLKDRKQSVVLGNHRSSSKSVLSGVPQGSILGPILFVLFINDLHHGISEGTNMSLYADDTKIWRVISSESDIKSLQNDIDTLISWTKRNLMKFNKDKCKVLTVHNSHKIYHIEGVNSPYSLEGFPLKTVEVEKDLGVDITPKLNWEHQILRLCSKASQKLGLLRRNCYFVNDKRRARVLYITLVRSIFQSCSVVWRPTNKTLLTRVESIQKRALKWVLNEENLSYSCPVVYVRKCKELNILPMSHRFDLTDIVLLHKIIHSISPIKLPFYLHFYTGTSLRSSHLDAYSLVSDIIPNTTASQSRTTNAFANAYFYRSHVLWNSLPLKIRTIKFPRRFKSELKAYFWKNLSNLESSSFSDNDIDC